MSLIVDASVAFKLCMPEPGSDIAERLLTSSTAITAPDLMLVELGSALRKAVRRGMLPVLGAESGLERIVRLFPVLHSASVLARRAFRIANDLDHAIYDCFYLALVEREQIPLVSADERLIAKLAGSNWQSWVRPLSTY